MLFESKKEACERVCLVDELGGLLGVSPAKMEIEIFKKGLYFECHAWFGFFAGV